MEVRVSRFWGFGLEAPSCELGWRWFVGGRPSEVRGSEVPGSHKVSHGNCICEEGRNESSAAPTAARAASFQHTERVSPLSSLLPSHSSASLSPPTPPKHKTRPAVETLVVSFGSAPGIPNWGGLISKLYGSAQTAEQNAFDVLYVVDPGRSWYSGGDPAGTCVFVCVCVCVCVCMWMELASVKLKLTSLKLKLTTPFSAPFDRHGLLVGPAAPLHLPLPPSSDAGGLYGRDGIPAVLRAGGDKLA
jgi:hypothetical protein